MMYQQFHGMQCIPTLQPLILFGRYPEIYIPGTDYLMMRGFLLLLMTVVLFCLLEICLKFVAFVFMCFVLYLCPCIY